MAEDGRKRDRRIYGKGFYDGLLSAKKQEGNMNSAKISELERNITSIARKVLEAVPVSEPWNRHKIMAELTRTGHHIDVRTVDGCLFSLKDTGLIKEPSTGFYQRVTAAAKFVPGPDSFNVLNGMPPSILQKTESQETPLEKMAAIAKDMRGLADQVDAIAIEVEDSMKKINADAAKMRQFQELLQSIGK